MSVSEKQLRQFFKGLNRFMIWMWRLGLGSWVNLWPAGMGRIMVLTHTGRKSGQPRRTPVNYALIGEDIYCTAGFGTGADWYRNSMANPTVAVWLPDGWWTATIQDVTDEADSLEKLRTVLINSGFAAPAAGIDPRRMSDAELAAATRMYRLLRIHRTAACTGSGGPGDLAWVWPVLVMVMLPRWLKRRR